MTTVGMAADIGDWLKVQDGAAAIEVSSRETNTPPRTNRPSR